MGRQLKVLTLKYVFITMGKLRENFMLVMLARLSQVQRIVLVLIASRPVGNLTARHVLLFLLERDVLKDVAVAERTFKKCVIIGL